MQELTKKIYDLLKSNNIKDEDTLGTLYIASQELQYELWETLQISPMMFYSLKDIIWYNLEHLPNNGEPKGLTTLKHLGTKFPFTIYCCNESNIISVNYAKELLLEIETIIKSWNKNWRIAALYTKSSTGWHGGEEPSKVIIYDGRSESPTKYGYNQNYGSILGSNGKNIKKLDEDIVLCSLDIEIGEYVNGQILYNLLIQLREVCKKSIANNKDIRIEFEQASW